MEGPYDTCWLTGLWSTQAKVEAIVLKVAWHWGSDCTVINDPIGEPGCTPLYIGLHPHRAPWTVTKCSSIFPFFGDPQGYGAEASGDGHHSL